MKRISVIIPVYKVEKYLDKCVESVVNQTYKNLEIILVDDGSPDNCPKICDDWAKKDKRTKVIHKENGGVSSARNLGLEKATGDYIAFVDSDDWIEETMYEKLFQKATETDADIIFCRFKNIDEDTGKTIFVNEVNLSKLETNFDLTSFIMNEFGIKNDTLITKNVMGSCCRCLIKKELVCKTRFKKLTVLEDLIFIIDILNKTPKIAIVDDYLYNYVQRKSSAIHQVSEVYIEKYLESYFCLYSRLEGRVSQEVIDASKFHNYVRLINTLIQSRNKKGIKQLLKNEQIKEYSNKTRYLSAKKLCNQFKYKVAYWMVYRKRFNIYSLFLKLKKS